MHLLDTDIQTARAIIIDPNPTSRSVLSSQLRDLGVQHVRQLSRVHSTSASHTRQSAQPRSRCSRSLLARRAASAAALRSRDSSSLVTSWASSRSRACSSGFQFRGYVNLPIAAPSASR